MRPVRSRKVFSSSALRSGVSKMPPDVSRIHKRSARGRASFRAPRESLPALPSARDRRDPCLRAAARSAASGRAGSPASARSAARQAAFSPAWSPSKHSTGSPCHAPQQFQLVFGQRGAERGDHVLEAGLRQRDHVHIAFDGDDRAVLAQRLPGAREIVEHVALVEELGLGRVHVFGERIRRQRAAAEGDHPLPGIGDRKHDAIAEAVVGDRDVVAVNRPGRTPPSAP